LVETKLREALARIREGLPDVVPEDELEKLFHGKGFYEALGYRWVGRDILSKRNRGRVPDVLLLNEDESIQVVIEFKRPQLELSGYSEQLLRYIKELRPSYGLLTNGKAFWLYRRRGLAWEGPEQYTLEDLLNDPSPLEVLAKVSLELRDQGRVLEVLKRDEEDLIPLEGPQSEGGHQFIHAFGLTKEGGQQVKDPGEFGPFGQLVRTTHRLVGTFIQRSRFLEGAYSFWRKAYAHEPETLPKAWEAFGLGKNREELYRFMFALETAYALTARLILAKAVQDHSGKEESALSLAAHLERVLGSPEYKKGIPPTAYTRAVKEVFEAYAERFLTSVYASDIFDWWREATGKSPEEEAFGEALGRVILALFRFNFRTLEGDFLGELYQHYFDPETRKALGEFYTPPAVVRFILDQVGYEGEGRLLDPACGSGTFLIEALRRFLNRQRQNGVPERGILRKLTEDYLLVGFDINPFAVMMSQVNLASHLVKTYLKALEEDPDLVLRHLPVVQTDSLRQELIEGREEDRHFKTGTQESLKYGEKEITLKVPLPLKAEEGEPVAEITFPNPDTAVGGGLVRNDREWILAFEALFDAVAEQNQNKECLLHLNPWSELLKVTLRRVGLNGNDSSEKEGKDRAEALAERLSPYAEKVWQVLEKLRPEHGDGRFLKALTNFALGMVLKHVLKYDFVVGNPPYVRIQNLPEFQKAHWKDRYAWVEGNFDIYIPFVERALQKSGQNEGSGWLEEGGKLGYIIPDRFLTVNYAAPLREGLPQKATLVSLTDLGAATFKPSGANTVPREEGGLKKAERLFREAMVYPAIVVLENKRPEKPYRFRVARFLPKALPVSPDKALEAVQLGFASLSPERDHLPLLCGGRDCGDVFLAESDWLWRRGWYLMPPCERKVWEKLDQVGRLPQIPPGSDVFSSEAPRLAKYTATQGGGFQGISTGLDEVMVLKQVGEDKNHGLLYLVPKGKEGDPAAWQKPVALEREVLRPFLFGRDVDRWHLSWKGYWVIFPYWYGQVGNKKGWHLIPTKENLSLEPYSDWPQKAPLLDRDYPYLWAYLKEHEERLRAREGGSYREGKEDEWRWYDLAVPRSLEAATGPKLLVQLLASSAKYASDEEGKFLFQGGGKGGGAYGISLKDDFKHLAPVFLGLLNSSVADFYLKHISSVYSGGFWSYADAFLKWVPVPEATDEQKKRLAEYVGKLTEKVNEYHEVKEALASFPQGYWEELKQSEKAPSRDVLQNLARWGDLPQKVSAKQAQIQTDLQAQTVLRLGKSELLFRHEPHARLALEILRERGVVLKEKFLEWELPQDPQDVEAFLGHLKELRNRRQILEQEIQDLEKRLNEAVSDLFGLSPKEQEVIDEFLVRFSGS